MEEEMTSYFQEVLQEVKQQACYSRYAESEETIKGAVRIMNTLYQDRHDHELKKTARDELKRQCAGNACSKAADMILSSLDGDSGLFGCDMVELLREGDASGDWIVGYRDMMAKRLGYLVSLANHGIIAHTAVLTIQEHEKHAWKVVAQDYQDRLKETPPRIQKSLDEAKKNFAKYV